MGFSKYIALGTALAVAVHANPAALPQAPNFPQINAAPTVASGPEDNGFGKQLVDCSQYFDQIAK